MTSQETIARAIVRGEETGAIPQALFLHTRSATGEVHCTASYIAPRVVLTAAHCVRPNSFAGVSYVYFGTEHAPAFGVLRLREPQPDHARHPTLCAQRPARQ